MELADLIRMRDAAVKRANDASTRATHLRAIIAESKEELAQYEYVYRDAYDNKIYDLNTQINRIQNRSVFPPWPDSIYRRKF